jgi:hypothetical protein
MSGMSETEAQALEAAAVTETPAKTAKGSQDHSFDDELTRRLKLGSTQLVAELWAITQKQLDTEVARHTRLEAKATSLLTAVGLSMTVAFTFGATLLTQRETFKDYQEAIYGAYGLAIMCGLLSAAFASSALLLIEQLQVDEEFIFNRDILKHSDRSEAADEAEGLMEYRKAAILHFWPVRRRYDQTYREKSALVKRGQFAFIGFLLSLLLLCMLIVVAVISQGS